MTANPKVVGVKPKPRALIHGFDAETTKQLADLFPTSLEDGRSLGDLRLQEWDLVVAKGQTSQVPAHMDLVLFGTNFGAANAKGDNLRTLMVCFDGVTHAQEFFVWPGIHPDVSALAERVLLPRAQREGTNTVLATYEERPPFVESGFGRPTGSDSLDPREDWVTPFLCTTEPRVLAGSFVRIGGRSETWGLPEDLVDPVPWVRAAVRVWHQRSPEKYPHDPGWPSDPRWMTASERQLVDAVSDVERERAEYLDESVERETKLRAELRDAQDGAERGPRQLLTAQGDALLGTVQTVLEKLEFDVENRDAVVPAGTPRLEDLRVTSPQDDPNWVAIAEIRGYTGGAALNDLLRIHRFKQNFRDEMGRYPDRSWYLVNQFIGRDPGSPPRVLEAHPVELAEFERQGGMAMDTADLFELAGDVDAEVVSKADARGHLMAALGRATWTSDR
jgi:hypothetical protein